MILQIQMRTERHFQWLISFLVQYLVQENTIFLELLLVYYFHKFQIFSILIYILTKI